MAEQRKTTKVNEEYTAGHVEVLEGLEAVRMREKEEAVMLAVGLPRGSSYVLEDEDN